MSDYGAAYGDGSYSVRETKDSKKDKKDALDQYGIDVSNFGGRKKRRKSRRRTKKRRKKSRKKKRRKRGGASNWRQREEEAEAMRKEEKRVLESTDVKDLVNIFYKPPKMAQPNKTQHGVGVSSWESHFVTLGNQIRCYMGNMASHKNMSRDEYIKTKSGFSNPIKRQKAWDSCKNNDKANYDRELIVKYFAKHGFNNPNNLKSVPNFVQIKASPLPNGHAIVTKLMREKQASKHTGMKYGGRKSRRRRKKRTRKKKTKRRRRRKR